MFIFLFCMAAFGPSCGNTEKKEVEPNVPQQYRNLVFDAAGESKTIEIISYVTLCAAKVRNSGNKFAL